jgi:phenylpropionate dioxygenase-like ring-hydroxylating dioxygenase large terminal subunit
LLLTNQWYVVGEAASFGPDPVAVRALGQELVLFRRRSDQQLVALADRCPHRMARLSGGCVDGDQLRCPYHHWAFGADGTCGDIPSAPRGSRIPPRARVDSYAVEERYGWVWVFLGDREPRPPLPPLPGYGEEGWRAVRGQYTWRAHYTRVVENAVDIAHTPFLHATSFGNPEQPEMPAHEVDEDDWASSIEVSLATPEPKGLTRLFVSPGSKRIRLGVWAPSVNWLDASFPNGWRMVLLLANLPVEEGTTLTFWLQLRTFLLNPLADPIARRLSLQILDEDRATVEAQGASPVPLSVAGDLSTRADALSLAYRRRLAGMAGDAIDRAAVAELAKEGRYVAIPSAARRAEASSFVFPAVPRGGSVEDEAGGAQRGVGERPGPDEEGVGDVALLK